MLAGDLIGHLLVVSLAVSLVHPGELLVQLDEYVAHVAELSAAPEENSVIRDVPNVSPAMMAVPLFGEAMEHPVCRTVHSDAQAEHPESQSVHSAGLLVCQFGGTLEYLDVAGASHFAACLVAACYVGEFFGSSALLHGWAASHEGLVVLPVQFGKDLGAVLVGLGGRHSGQYIEPEDETLILVGKKFELGGLRVFPADFAVGLADLAAEPADLAAEPADFAVGLADFAAGPADFAAGPADFAAGPADFAAGLADLAVGLADFAGGPVDLAVPLAVWRVIVADEEVVLAD